MKFITLTSAMGVVEHERCSSPWDIDGIVLGMKCVLESLSVDLTHAGPWWIYHDGCSWYQELVEEAGADLKGGFVSSA